MINIILLSLATCNLPPYPRNLTGTDYLETFTVTEAGAQKYFDCVVRQATQYIQMIQIPNLYFNLGLGVTNIDFRLEDIKIQNVDITELKAAFLNDDKIRATVSGGTISVTLQWGFQQSSFPFVKDGGTGVIKVNNANIQAVVSADADNPECQNHYILKFDQGAASFGEIKLDLQGGSSWIYQSMINLVLDMVTGAIEKTFSNVFMQGIMKMLNNVFEENSFVMGYLSPYEDIWKDERQVGTWRVGQGYFATKVSGRIFNKFHLEDEYVTQAKVPLFTLNQNSHDISSGLPQIAFQNEYYIFHKYHDLYSDPARYNVTEMPSFSIVNTGCLLSFPIQVRESKARVELQGKFKVKAILRPNAHNVTQNTTYIFVDFRFFSASDRKIVDEQLQKVIVERFNFVSNSTGYQINEMTFTSGSMWQVALDSKERVLRLVGDVEKCN